MAAFNHRGVKIAREAREAAAREVLIAGSIGPVGFAPEIREMPAAEIREIYHEQALALEERGVDFFLLETFANLDVLLAAVDAIRSFSALPIVAQMTFSEEGMTIGGIRPREAAARLVEKDVQAIGANCTLGPQSILPILEELAKAGRPLSAMPNAGYPKRVQATASSIRAHRPNISLRLGATQRRSARASWGLLRHLARAHPGAR